MQDEKQAGHGSLSARQGLIQKLTKPFQEAKTTLSQYIRQCEQELEWWGASYDKTELASSEASELQQLVDKIDGLINEWRKLAIPASEVTQQPEREERISQSRRELAELTGWTEGEVTDLLFPSTDSSAHNYRDNSLHINPELKGWQMWGQLARPSPTTT